MTNPLCSHPGCTEPHDNWPDGTPNGHLCQEHWEEECSREWWEILDNLDRAGVRGVLA